MKACFSRISRKAEDNQSIFQRGVALVEMAIVMPVLATIMIGLIDCGIMLTHYMTMTQIAHEGVRMGSNLAALGNLDRGISYSCNYNGGNNVCMTTVEVPASSSGTNPEALQDVAYRVVQLTNIERFRFKDDYFIQVSQSVDAVTGDSDITVAVRGTYKSVFTLFDNAPLRVSVSGPYLF